MTDPPISKATWTAREVLKDIDDKPHLLVALELRGARFERRGAPTFARILGAQGTTSSWFARVTDSHDVLVAYFADPLPAQGAIEYGYGNTVAGRIPLPFQKEAVERLDRGSLPKGTVASPRGKTGPARSSPGPD